jgi:LacI family transcriptional regulator
MSSPVTVREIAAECGLHFTTVALALRKSPKISLATRARVEDVAARLGYRPNPLVSALMAQKRALRKPRHSSVVGYVSFFPQDHKPPPNSFQAHYLSGARERCYELGYRLETFSLAERGMTATRLAQILRTRAIPGLLFSATPQSKGHLPRSLHEFASVALGYSLARPKLNRVAHSHYQGSMLACRTLRRKGYQRIGLVLTTMMDNQMERLWSAGYLSFHEHLPPSSHPTPLYLPLNEFPHDLLTNWVTRENPDVILTMHLQVKDWLDQNSRRFRRNIAIATLDHSAAWKGCGGIWQKPAVMGRQAISFLTSQIQNNQHGLPAEPITLMIEGEWRDAPPGAAN